VPDYVIPARGPEDWRALLAAPDLHWRTGASAFELAHSWHGRKTPPAAVQRVLTAARVPDLDRLEIILALPERKTALAGGSRGSQTDLLCLARRPNGGHTCTVTPLVVLGVEGKAEEESGPTLTDWLATEPAGAAARLAQIDEVLGVDTANLGGVRYQHLHRTTATVLEARLFNAASAVMLVHSFSAQHSHFGEFQNFVAEAFGKSKPEAGELIALGRRSGVQLYVGWVVDMIKRETRPGDALAVAEQALAWLGTHYRAQRLFAERDVEAAIQRRLGELVRERRLPLRVFHSFPVEQGARRALCADLALLGPTDDVELIMEIKYVPARERHGKDIWPGKFPAADWPAIVKDIERLRRWVANGRAKAGLGILVDEGGFYTGRAVPTGTVRKAWKIGSSKGPHPQVLITRV
jgi:hypothetical protein